MRAPLSHRGTGQIALVPRLLGKAMQHETVDASAIGRVADGLQPLRSLAPLAVARNPSEGLCFDDVLPALPQRGDRGIDFIRAVASAAGPELGHDPVHLRHDLVLPPGSAVRFAEKLQLRLMQCFLNDGEVVVVVEVFDRLIEITPELV